MAETTNFNYIDSLMNSTNVQFMADQHDHAIQTTGRKSYIFLLDKVETELSEVYKEEVHGRVYLPHFEQRALYKTNTFISSLDAANYTEKEDNLEMEFDFGRMVHNINELKSKTAGKLTLINNSKIPLEFEINENLIIRNYSEILYKKPIEGSVYNFINEVMKETSLVKFEYSGDSEVLDFLEKLNFKLLPRRKQEIILNNSIYKNTSDVISHGTLVLNDRMKLYQVVGAYPKNDSYGQYISWNVQLQIFNLAKADGLPNDFKELIEENQYGLGKIRI
jgi:hypothetical protein